MHGTSTDVCIGSEQINLTDDRAGAYHPPMDPTTLIESLRAKVKKHGRYRLISQATGLSESFVRHFAIESKIDYQVQSLQLLSDYFASAASRSRRRRSTPEAIAQ